MLAAATVVGWPRRTYGVSIICCRDRRELWGLRCAEAIWSSAV